MPGNPGKLTRLWHELKRRKVFGVFATYTASAYIIIEVVNNLAGPFRLPEWIPTLVALLLVAGLPVTVIISWIFDFTPEGIKKTESCEEADAKEVKVQPLKRKLKLSYVLNGFLLIAVIVLAYPRIFRTSSVKRLSSSGEKIAVAVMPFKNMTNDTTWNIWQEAIQQSLISYLSNTGELKVRQKETINNNLASQNITDYASLSPFIAGKISKKLASDIFIFGSIQKSGSRIRIDAQLTDTKSNDILKSFEIIGPYVEGSIFDLTDTLRNKLVDFLVISKLIRENPEYKYASRTTNSPEAFRYFVYGGNALRKGDCSSAISWYLKSISVDSNFFYPYYDLITAYSSCGLTEEKFKWIQKCYDKREQWPMTQKLWASQPYTFHFKSLEELNKLYNQLAQIDEFYTMLNLDLAWLSGITGQFDKAITEYEKVLEKARNSGNTGIKKVAILNLIEEYHNAGKYKKEKTLFNEALRLCPDPDHYYLILYKAANYLREDKPVAAERYFRRFSSLCKQFPAYSETDSIEDRGYLYYKAGLWDKFEEHYRKAISQEPENLGRVDRFTQFSIKGRISDINEFAELMDNRMTHAPDKFNYYLLMDFKGWGYYMNGYKQEALSILQTAWDSIPYKMNYIKDHLEQVKTAISGQTKSQ